MSSRHFSIIHGSWKIWQITCTLTNAPAVTNACETIGNRRVNDLVLCHLSNLRFSLNEFSTFVRKSCIGLTWFSNVVKFKAKPVWPFSDFHKLELCEPSGKLGFIFQVNWRGLGRVWLWEISNLIWKMVLETHRVLVATSCIMGGLLVNKFYTPLVDLRRQGLITTSNYL